MSNLGTGLGEKWYAVRVIPQNELKISNVLREKVDVDSHAFCRKVWKLINGKRVISNKPLLSTYIFIFANLKKINWRLFYSAGRILGPVKFGGTPAPIPEEQILNLKRLCASESPVHDFDISKLKPNDKVEVICGPLKGAVGSYQKFDEKSGKFIVNFDLFNRALATEIEENYIRPY
ncbi:MAG: transcription termination factor NusG domain protein [bacterium]|nr:MAG: transcription termination factor NusG domain protein [bacterium]